MNITTYPQVPIIDKDGNLSVPWKQFFDLLITQINLNLSDSGGFVIPSQPQSNVNQLAMNVNIQNGTLIFNSDTSKLLVWVNGAFHVVQVV